MAGMVLSLTDFARSLCGFEQNSFQGSSCGLYRGIQQAETIDILITSLICDIRVIMAISFYMIIVTAVALFFYLSLYATMSVSIDS